MTGFVRSNPPAVRRGSNGPNATEAFEEELGQLARSVERAPESEVPEHPAMIACKRAAEMVRGVHERHASEGETFAQHIEHIGETFMKMCKQMADDVRNQRILPEEMSVKMADELIQMGQMEAERQARVSRGLIAARDALLGIDQGAKG